MFPAATPLPHFAGEIVGVCQREIDGRSVWGMTLIVVQAVENMFFSSFPIIFPI